MSFYGTILLFVTRDRGTMDFGEFIEEQPYNLVIDFPASQQPRVRVYLLEADEDDGILYPVELLEFPSKDACSKAGSYLRLYGNPFATQRSVETENITIMLSGLSAVANFVYQWYQKYQDDLGQVLFPSPQHLAELITTQVLETLTASCGVFYYGPRQVKLNFSDEEEYRPGIYL